MFDSDKGVIALSVGLFSAASPFSASRTRLITYPGKNSPISINEGLTASKDSDNGLSRSVVWNVPFLWCAKGNSPR